MNDKKLTGWLYLVSAVWYLVGMIRLVRTGFASGIVWLCLGSTFLCLAAAGANMAQKSKEKEDTEEDRSDEGGE